MKSIKDIAMQFFKSDQMARCGGAHEICLNCAVCRADEPDETYSADSAIASIIDATVLKADTSIDDVTELCRLANEHKTASVCINSFFIPHIKQALNPGVKSCTVINFPLGSGSVEAVRLEAEAVLSADVDEVDMVQNLSAVKSQDWAAALMSIQEVATLCTQKGALLKVILETCYLDREELIISCLMSKKVGAKYVKTSTGFGSEGAKAEDIALMRAVVGPKFGVKASGGIRTKQAAQEMIKAGASRIGASNITALL